MLLFAGEIAQVHMFDAHRGEKDETRDIGGRIVCDAVSSIMFWIYHTLAN